MIAYIDQAFSRMVRFISRHLIHIVMAVVLLLVLPLQAQDRRIALIIGNGAYHTSAIAPLPNPPNDICDIKIALQGLGFEIRDVVDGTYEQMCLAIDAFGRDLKHADVGLFYYAGHGVQVNGSNYLIPVDANLPDASLVRFRTVALDEVLAYMDQGSTRLNLCFLDACRDNPLPGSSRGLTRGLAVVKNRPQETLIVYATAANEVAADGRGRNSPFTQAFLNHIATPGQDVYDLYRTISVDVQEMSGGRQRPELFGNVSQKYALVPTDSVVSPERNSFAIPKQETFGSISVHSISAGTLYLDGVSVGASHAGQNISLDNIKIGTHLLEIRYADGHRQSQSVLVPSGTSITIHFSHRTATQATTISAQSSNSKSNTSGVAFNVGYGYEYAGLGAALELYLHYKSFGLGGLLGAGYFPSININGIETDGAIGFGVGTRLVLGSRHRCVVDLHYGLAGTAAREQIVSGSTVRDTATVYGTTTAIGYQFVAARGFTFQILVGQTFLDGADEWVTNILGDQILTLNLGIGYKIH